MAATPGHQKTGLACFAPHAALVELPTDLRTLTALYRIAHLAGTRNEPEAVLHAILDIVIEAVGGASGDISLVNPDTGQLEVEMSFAHGDATDDELKMRLGQGITGWAAFHGQPQNVPDVSLDPRYVRFRDHVRSEMVAPMISENGQVMGVINVDGDKVNAFSEKDFRRLLVLTQEATRVLMRHWELQNLTGKANQLSSLVTIGQSLVSQLEPEELLHTVARDAREIMGVRACGLFLHDPEAKTLRLVSYDGPTPDLRPTDALPLESCMVAACVNNRKTVEFGNVQTADFRDVSDLPREPGLRSMLATPLLIDREVMGVIVVFSGNTRRFNNDEKRLLSALSSLGAVALQNSRLYTRVFQSEAQLRKNEQLTTLGLLAAEIAHEIRNPLTVLKLLFGTLKLEFAAGDPRTTDARVIREKLNELEAIVSRVLNFAKAPSSLHSRWNVTDIVDDTLVLIRLKLAQSKITLDFERPPEPLIVDVHKGQLQQVLLNLLLNATQAMPKGGQITIKTVVEDRAEAGRQLSINVADTGPGIAAEHRERIFDSFLSGRPDGTGLGLAIAKRILVSHHGDLILRRTGPAGTTMSIVLPLA